jgi:hypothetical protein
MLGNETLWETVTRCHELLEAGKIPHAIVGGVAVCLHGYQRNTVDVDLLVRSSETAQIRALLERAGFVWSAEQAEYRLAIGQARIRKSSSRIPPTKRRSRDGMVCR